MSQSSRKKIRESVWRELRKVAIPDSRFHLDFTSFIPDYEGSMKCVERLRSMDVYSSSKVIMATPDNNVCKFREYCILDGKTVIMSTYAIARGFLMIVPTDVPKGKEDFASTLDGFERFGKPISLVDIKRFGRINLIVTGASAVNMEGIRYGKGHGYFDLEWGMFREIDVVSEETPIVVFVHDCQLIDSKLPLTPFDTIVDIIITPTRVIHVKKKHKKPTGIIWDKLAPKIIKEIPPLMELEKKKVKDQN